MGASRDYQSLLEKFTTEINRHLVARDHKGDFTSYGRNAPLNTLVIHMCEEAGEIAAIAREMTYHRGNVYALQREILDLGALAFALWLKANKSGENAI